MVQESHSGARQLVFSGPWETLVQLLDQSCRQKGPAVRLRWAPGCARGVGVGAEAAAVPTARCPGVSMLPAICVLSSPSPRLQRQWVGTAKPPAR